MKYNIICLLFVLVSEAEAVFLRVDAPVENLKLQTTIAQRAWKVSQLSTLTPDMASVELQLPDGVQAIILKKKSRTENSRLHWQGRVLGDPFGQAAFVQNGSQVSGEVVVGGRRFVITQLQNELVAIETAHADIEGHYKKAPTPDFSAQAAITTPSTDNFIDVMIVYTDDVGVNADAEATLRARVDATNEMLASSCANFRYRLVYIGQVNYAETGAFSTDLSALANTSDGIMDTVHTLRDTYGADLVQLVTDTGDACGLGYLGQDGFYNEDYGFSVSLYWCNARTMAHEWGHNLSISHDRYEEDVTLYEETNLLDGYGFVDLANKYRDVMSYNTQCNDAGVTCTALDMFSNPRISHNTIPFGLHGYADSVSRMNASFPYIANFRVTANPYVADIDNNCVGSRDNKDLHCFVASTVYKSYHHNNVSKLRAFRDQWLKGNTFGKKIISLYYQYSPVLAQKMQKYPTITSTVAFFLSAFLFLLEYGVYFLALQVLVLITALSYRKKSLTLLPVFLAVMFASLPTRAQVAAPSRFIYLAGPNPSVRLFREAKPFASMQYIQEEHSTSTTAYSEESDSQKLNLMLAYISNEYFFEIQFSPTRKYDHTLTQTGFANSTTEYAEQDYLVQAGSYFFGLPIGFKYQNAKLENLSSQQKTKNRAMGAGTTLQLANYLNVGAGVDLREQTGDGLAKAQWLQPYLGVALGQMPQKTNLAPGGNEFFIEAGFLRSPEVQNSEGATVTSLGAATETFFAGEVSLSTGLVSMDQIFARLSSKTRKEKATDYIVDDVEIKTTAVHLGFTIPYSGDKLLMAVMFERGERAGDITDETKYVGLTISYQGMGGASASSSSRSY